MKVIKKNSRFIVTVLVSICMVSTLFLMNSTKISASTINSPIEFPGKKPGNAVANVEETRFSIGNDIITMKWTKENNDYKLFKVEDKLNNVENDINLNKLFSIKLNNGKIIKSSEFKVKKEPILLDLNGNLDSVRYSERDAGKSIQTTFEYNNESIGLEVVWAVNLRNNSNNVQQKFDIRVLKGSVNISNIELLEGTATNLKLVGYDDGKTIISNNLFLGIESPLSKSSVDGNKFNMNIPKGSEELVVGRTLEYTLSIGISPEGQMQRAFNYYVQRDRDHYRKSVVNYCTWWDLYPNGEGNNEKTLINRIQTFGEELGKKRGFPLDVYSLDDKWDDTNGEVWSFDKTAFPNEFKTLSDEAKKYNGAMGVWFSPFGGYGENSTQRRNANSQYITNGTFHMAYAPYYNRVKSMIEDMILNQGVKYVKMDGIGGGLYTQGPSNNNRLDYEYLLELCKYARELDPEVFLNITTGTWSSPYWFWFCDTIHMDGEDQSFVSGGSTRQQLMSGKDTNIYEYNVQQNQLLPLTEFMNGIIFTTKTDPWKPESIDLSDAETLKEFKDEVKWIFAQGGSLRENVIRPEEAAQYPVVYDEIARYGKWYKNNLNVLTDNYMIGYPGSGEIYGYRAWSEQKSILSLRNPYSEDMLYKIQPTKDFNIPSGSNINNLEFKEIDQYEKDFVVNKNGEYYIKIPGYGIRVFEVVPTDKVESEVVIPNIPKVVKVEAESGTLSGAAKIANNNAASGGKVVGFLGNSLNNKVQLNFDVDNAGKYIIKIAGFTDKTRPLDIIINGNKQHLSFTGNGWSNQASITLEVNLNKGANTMELTSENGYAPDIDFISYKLSN